MVYFGVHQQIVDSYLIRLNEICVDRNSSEEEFDYLICLLFNYCVKASCFFKGYCGEYFVSPTLRVLSIKNISLFVREKVLFALLRKGADINYVNLHSLDMDKGDLLSVAIKNEYFNIAKRILNYKRIDISFCQKAVKILNSNILTLKKLEKNKDNITDWNRYFERDCIIEKLTNVKNKIIDKKMSA